MSGLAVMNPLVENPRYRRLYDLGQGSFGKVILALDEQTNEQVAIKCLVRGERNKYIESEIVNHSLLRHPHIIQFKEVFLTSQYVCIVMEYASAGTLFQYVQKQKKPNERHGRLKESMARWFFQQLVIALDYCHKRGVVNRDVKMENALLQVVEGVGLPILKMCDFGYSKADHMSDPKSKVGTLAYMAPEVLLSRNNKYDGKTADAWSCGVMLFVMLCGRYPFGLAGTLTIKPQEVFQMLERMVSRQYAFPDAVELSASCKDLLERLLDPHPNTRTTLDQLQYHPWFQQNLPQDARTMNDMALRMSSGFQIDEMVGRIHQLLSTPIQAPRQSGQEETPMLSVDQALQQGLHQRSSTSLRHYINQHRD